MGTEGEHYPRLEFCWHEPKSCEKSLHHWAQLAVSIHRLCAVGDELGSVVEDRDIERSLRRLAYHVQNYLNHVFELLDRALSVVSTITGRAGVAKDMGNPQKREAALLILKGINVAHAEAVTELLAYLQADIDLRNQNTHETYLSIGLNTGDDVYDPGDALLDLQSQSGDRGQLEGLLRCEMERVVEQYQDKIRTVISLSQELLRQTDPTETI